VTREWAHPAKANGVARWRTIAKYLRRWPAIGALAVFAAAAGWIVVHGRREGPHAAPSLAAALHELDVESAFGLPATLEPGTLIRAGTFSVVAAPSEAFDHPERLRYRWKTWMESGKFEDSLTAEIDAEADILGFLGLKDSKATLTDNRV